MCLPLLSFFVLLDEMYYAITSLFISVVGIYLMFIFGLYKERLGYRLFVPTVLLLGYIGAVTLGMSTPMG